MPSTFTVTNTLDDGSSGSLRWAINQVNADTTDTAAQPDVIAFNIPTTDPGYSTTSGAWTIQPLSALPAITNAVVINGYTQPGASPNKNAMTDSDPSDNAVLRIVLNGSQAGDHAAGLLLRADNSTVEGLVINGFDTFGIEATSVSGTTVTGNFIGTDVTGKQPVSNDSGGVRLNAVTGAVIGGVAPAARNVISGNIGIHVYESEAGFAGNGVDLNGGSGTVIEGNFIGTDVTGARAVWNSYYGVSGNSSTGVSVWNARGTVIGGTTPAARNLISGNWLAGVNIFGGASNVVEGNDIGTDATGTIPLGNGRSGVTIASGATGNTVGGTVDGSRNIISGNGPGSGIPTAQGDHRGVEIRGAGTTGNVVEGNYIGTDASGETGISGVQDGVYIGLGATDNTIGGLTAEARNIISGNVSGTGVVISDSGTARNKVEGNYIGTDASGAKAVPNGNSGVSILGGATDNTVGGPTPEARNIISGNLAAGVWFADYGGPGTARNVVEGNSIGTDASGATAIGNAWSGVMVNGGIVDTTIRANLISGNAQNGVLISNIGYNGGITTGTVLTGNHIGTDAGGTAALGNAGAGVLIDGGSSGNMVGGTGDGAGNTIAFNGTGGLRSYQGARDNHVPAGAGLEDGVFVQQGSSDAILGNSIYANTGLGIELNSANAANDNQAAPVLTSASRSAGGTTVGGTLTSVAGTTFRIEFFASATLGGRGEPEGQTLLGSVNVTTGADGNASFSATLPAVPAGQQYLTATATRLDAAGNPTDTSGFTPLSQAQVLSANTATAITSPANPSVYGQAVSFTATVTATAPGLPTPTGTVQFLVDGSPLGDPVPLAGGTATSPSVASLPAGPHTITAVYSGDATFLGSSNTLSLVVNKADAALTVTPYSGTYDGQAHGLTGSATGVLGEDLSGLLNLGARYTNAGTYTVAWSFAGNADYNAASGTSTVTIAKATPTFSAVGTTVITDGTPSVTLSGTLSDGSLIPTGSVTVTVDGVSQTAALAADGTFSATFATASLNVGAHTVTFSYGGDANFTGASASGSLDATYGVLALFNQGRAKKPGSVLAIQIALATAGGQDVSSAGVTVTALGIAATTDTADTVGATDPSNVGTLTAAQSADGSNPNNVFRYQGGAHPFYMYNLQIPDGLAAGTYRLYFSIAGDPLVHWVTFTVG